MYQGEATQKADKSGYELDGQGKLETKGYLERWDIFSGRFVGSVRSGQATLIKKDAYGKTLLEFEGVFTDDMP